MALANIDVILKVSDGFGPAEVAGLTSLLFLPFAHEDLAIVFGAYAIVSDWLPAGLVALCIYGGMVTSDFALYGIGAGARRLPWLSRVAVNDRVHRFSQNLKRDLLGLFALCRLVPGAEFVAFVACGYARVPLARFAVASLLISALYLPITLCLLIVFGNALDNHAGLWTWPLLLAAMIATAFVRRRVFAFGSRGDGNDFTWDNDPESDARDEAPVPSAINGRMAPQAAAFHAGGSDLGQRRLNIPMTSMLKTFGLSGGQRLHARRIAPHERRPRSWSWGSGGTRR